MLSLKTPFFRLPKRRRQCKYRKVSASLCSQPNRTSCNRSDSALMIEGDCGSQRRTTIPITVINRATELSSWKTQITTGDSIGERSSMTGSTMSPGLKSVSVEHGSCRRLPSILFPITMPTMFQTAHRKFYSTVLGLMRTHTIWPTVWLGTGRLALRNARSNELVEDWSPRFQG